MRPIWSRALANGPRGLALARESGWLLAWDDQHWLYLLNQAGERQAQRHLAGGLVSACAADDGSAYAAADPQGGVSWLAPDLMARWERPVPHRPLALALDPFGQYLAAADAHGRLHLFDRHGRRLWEAPAPRPLHHLAFVPAVPLLIGCSDYGLAACFDLQGNCVWRDGLVAHIGSLAVSGAAESVALACFSEGLQRYDRSGRNRGRLALTEPCRLAALAFDGRLTLAAGLSGRLFLLDPEGLLLASHALDHAVTALVFAALGDRAVIALARGTLLCLAVEP